MATPLLMMSFDSDMVGYNLLPQVRNMKNMTKRLLVLCTLLHAPFRLLAQSSSPTRWVYHSDNGEELTVSLLCRSAQQSTRAQPVVPALATVWGLLPT
jgi:hypothetical protein